MLLLLRRATAASRLYNLLPTSCRGQPSAPAAACRFLRDLIEVGDMVYTALYETGKTVKREYRMASQFKNHNQLLATAIIATAHIAAEHGPFVIFARWRHYVSPSYMWFVRRI